MTIETKYDIGQEVWIISKGKAVKDVIDMITNKTNNPIMIFLFIIVLPLQYANQLVQHYICILFEFNSRKRR